MSYDYTKANDLVNWCKEQLVKKTKYKLGGIGRYEDNIRTFDCIGLIKCFLWHDYSTTNAYYYGKTAPDKNCEGYFNMATEKGPINTIPEVPGIIVYQKGHVGIYIGNGEVIEATAAFGSKVVKSYFKGFHTGNKRTTWTHWFKLPQLTYEVEKTDEEKHAEEVANNAAQFGLKVPVSIAEGKKFYLSRYATFYGGASLGVAVPEKIKNASTYYTAGKTITNKYNGKLYKFVLAKQINSYVRVDECMVK